MAEAWKPDGYPAASPYLIVAGAQRVIDFMQDVFAAEPLRRFDAPDGSVMHAEVRIRESVIMIGDANETWPPIATALHVYVEDVDASFQRALEAGGTAVQEPTRRDGDPDRRGGVRDPGGNTWWIATQVA